MGTKLEKDWLNINIGAILAILWTFFTFVIDTLVLTHSVKTADNTTYLILTQVNGIEMIIMGYYYVSSKASKDKDETINALTKGNEAKDLTIKANQDEGQIH